MFAPNIKATCKKRKKKRKSKQNETHKQQQKTPHQNKKNLQPLVDQSLCFCFKGSKFSDFCYKVEGRKEEKCNKRYINTTRPHKHLIF